MNARQNAHLNMYLAVKQVCDTHTAAWTSRTFFANVYTIFISNIAQIQSLISAQVVDNKGIAAQKAGKRTELTEQLLLLATAVKAAATDNEDMAAAQAATLHRTHLQRMRENELVGVATGLATRADAFSNLADYGITTAIRAGFDAALGSFTALIGAPKAAIAVVGAATDDMQRLFLETSGLLDERLDVAAKAMHVFSEDFAHEYFNARNIDDPDTHKLALRVHVTDSVTQQPVHHAKVLVTPGDIERFTSELGNCRVLHLPNGQATIDVSAPGYQPQSVTVAIGSKHTAEAMVVLMRA